MSSSDFTFITLRNITAYQPTGSWVPEHYILNMSTNGSATWTNSITLQSIAGSTLTGSSITGNSITGNSVTGNSITMSTIFGNTIYGTNVGGHLMTGSTIIGSTIACNNFVAISSMVLTPNFYSTTSNYSYIGTNAVSSMLIAIGDNLWKIPIEFVAAIAC